MNPSAEGPSGLGATSRGEPRVAEAGEGKGDGDHGVANGPEGVPLVGSEDKPEGETGVRIEAGPESGLEAMTEFRAEAMTEFRAEAGTEFRTEVGTEAGEETETEVGAEAGPEAGPQVGLDVEVVVARYREDTAWTRTLGLPCLVYDKSGQAGQPTPADASGQSARLVPSDASVRSGRVPLPNVGRETHTYLIHIVRRYESLAQHTVFVQADPFDHMGPGANPASFRERILQNVRLGVKFTGFAWYKLKCDRLGRPHALADPHKAGKWPGYGKDIPVGEVYEALFRGPVPETFLTQAPAGLLFVSKQRILARPQTFYRKALALVEADPDDARNTGHAFERLWPVIFGGNQALNKDRY